jgi:hypothetical protein
MKCSPERSEPPVTTDLRSRLNLCGAADAPFGIVLPCWQDAGARLTQLVNAMPRVGLISDTHGVLRPQAVRFFVEATSSFMQETLETLMYLEILQAFAPVTVVRGNNDKAS